RRLSENNQLESGLVADPTGIGVWQRLALTSGGASLPLDGAPSSIENFVDVCPFRITEEDLHRGMERFTIYCTPCHSPAGDGHGKILERGYLRPTNYHFEPPDQGDKDPTKSTKGLSRGFGRFRKQVVMSPVDPRRSD